MYQSIRTTAFYRISLLVFFSLLFSLTFVTAQSNTCTVTNISTSLGNNIFIPENETVSVILTNNHNDQSKYVYITTRKVGMEYIITGFLDSPQVSYHSSDVAAAPIIIWGFSFEGEILAKVGDDALTTQFSTICYNISRNCVMFFGTEQPSEPSTSITCGEQLGSIIINSTPNTFFILYDSADLSDSLASATTDDEGFALLHYITDDDSRDYLVQVNTGEVTPFTCPGITVMNPTQIVDVECMDTTRIITVRGNSNASYSIFDDAELSIRLGGGTAGLSGIVRIVYTVPLNTPLTDIDFLITDSNPEPFGLRFNCTGSLQDEDDSIALNENNEEFHIASVQEIQASIYPNPAVEQINIQLENLPKGEIILWIIDQQGQFVQQRILEQNNVTESTILPLSIGQLKRGFYQVYLQGEGFIKQLRFSKW